MANEEMNFDWSASQQIEEQNFPADTLRRSQYAELLTKYLCERSLQRSYVLNINSKWGSGKTYFIKRWVQTLDAHFDVVYVDAWKYDYSDDPLLTVISEIKKQVPRLSDKLSQLKIIGAMAKAGLPNLVSGFVKKYIGFDAESLGEKIEADFLASSTEKATEVLLQSFEQQREAISSFKNYLRELEPEKNKEKPFFIFIDELDRCRPTYAIELLETVKHLFDVPEFVFVIATDTEQLAHSICAIYGQGFDARTYLSRFFDDSYKLPDRDIRPFIESIGFPKLFDVAKDLVTPICENDSLIVAVCALFRHFNVSLREIEKTVARFQLFILQVEHKQKSFDPLFTILALIMGNCDKTLLDSVFNEGKVFYRSGLLNGLSRIEVTVYEEKQRTCTTNLKSLLTDRQKALNGEITSLTVMQELQAYGSRSGKYPPRDHDIYRKIAIVYQPQNRDHLSVSEYQAILENATLLE
ncbi:KAP family NTPase [Pseudidiomarina marina]|uniref:KAP family P-loop NTPase fold protein n=1 Tax=Pseudidiomarina marina TaxID=502366 RepID=UPI00384B0D11